MSPAIRSSPHLVLLGTVERWLDSREVKLRGTFEGRLFAMIPNLARICYDGLSQRAKLQYVYSFTLSVDLSTGKAYPSCPSY